MRSRRAYSSRWFAVIVGLGRRRQRGRRSSSPSTSPSHGSSSPSPGSTCATLLAWIAVPFVAIDALSLIDPDAFDENVLRPVLIALFLSQLIVFARLPALPPQARQADAGRPACSPPVAFALMAWGLYRAIAGPVST